MGKRILGGIMALLMTGAMTMNASASEIDLLIDKLVEKGVLSSVEAQIILDETACSSHFGSSGHHSSIFEELIVYLIGGRCMGARKTVLSSLSLL